MVLGVCLARLLTPEDFGAVAYAGALIGLICMPLEWTAAQILVADRGQNPELFSEVMSLGIVVMVAKLAVSVGVIVWQVTIGETMRAVLIAFAAAGMIAGTAAGIFRCAAEGSGHFKANFYVQAVGTALAFAVGIGGALAGWGAIALAAMGLATAIPPFFVFPRFVKHQFHWRFNRNVIKSRGSDGFWMWLQGTSSSALTRVDRLFLGNAVGEADLGNYTRAFNYSNLSSLALNSLITNPAVVSLANTREPALRRKILLTNGTLLFAGASVCLVLFGMFADPLVPFLFGEQWRSAIPTFQAFSPINFFAAFMYLPITLLLAEKNFRAVGKARFAGLLLLVALAWFYGKSLNAQKMAVILQISLFVPGIICWIAASSLLVTSKTASS